MVIVVLMRIYGGYRNTDETWNPGTHQQGIDADYWISDKHDGNPMFFSFDLKKGTLNRLF